MTTSSFEPERLIAHGSTATDPIQEAGQEEKQARLLLETVQAFNPPFARVCLAKSNEMRASGANDHEVLEELLKLARPIMEKGSFEESPAMSVKDALAMLDRS